MATKEEESISFLMKMITDRVTTLFRARAEMPLTAAQCRVVMYLESREGGPVSQREIEHFLGVTHTTARGLLRRLEEKDFVRTAFDDADRRVKNAYLTEKSREVHEALGHYADQLHEQLLRGISAGERKRLGKLLEQIYHNIR